MSVGLVHKEGACADQRLRAVAGDETGTTTGGARHIISHNHTANSRGGRKIGSRAVCMYKIIIRKKMHERFTIYTCRCICMQYISESIIGRKLEIQSFARCIIEIRFNR